jgi:hypothetical protein
MHTGLSLAATPVSGSIIAYYDRLGEAMRVLALVVALLSVPAFAADYTPWPGQERGLVASTLVEQAQQSCCKRCTKGQPCKSPAWLWFVPPTLDDQQARRGLTQQKPNDLSQLARHRESWVALNGGSFAPGAQRLR